MNSARHKWLVTIAKTHFASREARPLGVLWGLISFEFILVFSRPVGML